ncbi:Ribosomal protein L28 [Paramagnetospirillum magneticum AMB-1]|uniref:Ribosomal protein L28 n=1 Tax=Paramagnetospirillum magneticum (strain ATCC 700264 / AMB-1) TaxID=342108 RepID=Q2WAK0_PARM1|nr:Ribosomal protein L28 [Paramagnetospirillum magneticum AMB-1]
MRLRISTNGLKTIEHNGGIDSYLLSIASTKLSAEARRLKKRIERALASKQDAVAA